MRWIVAFCLTLGAMVLVIVPHEFWVRFWSMSPATQGLAVLWFTVLLLGAAGGVVIILRFARPVLPQMVFDALETMRRRREERARLPREEKRCSGGIGHGFSSGP
jgi:hypothetical protein